ncbi:MAG TPA: hypothetical protein VFX20_04905 [Steroidobacteraceae bacterium]|nr:hypothetical protein [Steroidobacteraceae bacterium]
MYFTEAQIGQSDPPAITHPEYFYGFIGVTLAWQLVFLLIARDPVRYRPIMLAAIGEKISYGIAALVLELRARVSPVIGMFGVVDLLIAALFLLSFCLMRPEGVAHADTPATA